MPRPATHRRHPSRVHRQQVQLIADHFRLRIDDDIDIPRTQTTPPSKKPKRKTSPQLKPIDQHVPARRKQLLNALFRRRAVWDITEISKQSFDVTALPFRIDFITWPTRLNEDRKRRQHTFRIP